MKYQGWNFEKTLLIHSDYPSARPNEFMDVHVAVETQSAQNLANDVRVILKPAWNQLGQEVPCQIYDIQKHGPVTAFRVAFVADIPANGIQRVGILYDNPHAVRPKYETDLVVSGSGISHRIENGCYRICTHPDSGQIDALTVKIKVLEYTHIKRLTTMALPQPGVGVVFAGTAPGYGGQPVNATTWRNPETTCVSGPLFFSLVRRGRLAPPGQPVTDKHPSLEIRYKFIADRPYFLMSSRLEFHADTPVYGICNDMMAVNKNCFSHYCFRPVTPSLPATDLEEAGHILTAPEYVQSLPHGVIFGGFLPYDLAWHAFISAIRKQDFRFDYALTSIRLSESAQSPGAPAPKYRAATYLSHDDANLSFYRAPVYVKRQDCAENVVIIPQGTVYSEQNALHLGEWDEKKNWLRGIDALGKRLNHRLDISQHPKFLGGVVPAERPELIPCGEFGHAYTKGGVR